MKNKGTLLKALTCLLLIPCFVIPFVSVFNVQTITGNTTVEYDKSTELTITPNPGYYISSVIVDGTEIDFKTIDNEIFSVNANGVGTYVFKNVQAGHLIKVVLPVPFGPNMHKTSPFSMEKLISLNISSPS